MQRSFVVEFAGTRGVGKSTLAAEVANALRKRGQPCNQRTPSGLPGKLAVWLRGHVSLVGGLWRIAGLRRLSWADLLRTARAYRSVRRRLERARKAPGVQVLEDGFFHLSARVHMMTSHDHVALAATCETLLRDLPLPDLVVFVEASKETIEARRRMRGRPRDLLYRHVPPVAVRTMSELQAVCARLATRSPGLGLITVVNEEPNALDDTAARIADLILEKSRTLSQAAG